VLAGVLVGIFGWLLGRVDIVALVCCLLRGCARGQV
jgi:hypothetical protein